MSSLALAFRRLTWSAPAHHGWWPWPLKDRVFVLLSSALVLVAHWAASDVPAWAMLAAVLLTSSLAMHARLALGLGQALGLVRVAACGLTVLGAGASIVGTSGLVALVGSVAIMHR